MRRHGPGWARGRFPVLGIGGVVLVALGLLSVRSASLLGFPLAEVVPDFGMLALAYCLVALAAFLISDALMRREKLRRRHAEARLSRLLQGANQADTLVTIVNRSGRIEYVNRAVEVTTGYAARELVGKRRAPALPWHAADPVTAGLWARLLAGDSFSGPVQCQRKDGMPFLLEEHVTPLDEGLGRTERFVSTARDVTRQRRIEERLAYVVNFDPLTDVANRGHFIQLLQGEIARRPPGERRLDLMVLDIDRFKYVNDLHSTEVGDAVLRRIAETLRACVGPQGIVGRLGSDEFGVFRERTRAADVAVVAQSVRDVLARPTAAAGQQPLVTVTIGSASCPQDGTDAATLLKSADIALTHAKSLGRGSAQEFSRELSKQALDFYSMQQHLASALTQGEYDVHYQPYCDLSTGRILGAEALIRWNRGGLGSVSPAKFIPALEESGLIVAVGEWVLQSACRQIGAWQNMRRPLPVAVNVSQRQFGHRDLAGMVADAVRGHAIDPRYLTLELTESMCLRDESFAIGQLGRLKDVGVSISVDDFGTGYSSLSHIKKLPVDTLKIDRSFVSDVTRDPDAASIVVAITGMARSLGLKTIAEGVESEEQRNVLHLLRCDMGQGYHFSPAVAAAAFERLVAA